jgi:hypothetical protein
MINWESNSFSLLAQVSFGTNLGNVLGLILIIAGIVLPLFCGFSIKPNQIFFSVAAITNGFILIFSGWRLDPILQFGQLILATVTIFYTVESIYLGRNRP